MNSGIYLILNMTNGKEYAGKAHDLHKRQQHHWCVLRLGKHGNSHLQSAWQKDGEKAFRFVVVEYIETDRLIERERWWVELLDLRNPAYGYNFCIPARGALGVVRSPETRAKTAAAARSRSLPNDFGAKVSAGKQSHPPSDESRGRMSAAAKRRWASPEYQAKISEIRKGNQNALGAIRSAATRAALSARASLQVGDRNPFYGKRHSDETRAKISAARKKHSSLDHESKFSVAKDKEQDKEE